MVIDENKKGPIAMWVKNQSVVAIIVTFLTILLGLVLTVVKKEIGWNLLAISLGIIFIIFVVIMWLVFRNVFTVAVNLSTEIKAALDGFLDKNKLGWIISTPQLVEFEARINCPEIWLITSDLQDDVVGGPFQDCVSTNLKKGVIYKYFVPDALDVRSKVQQILNYHKNRNLSVIYLNDEFFFLVPRFDFTIYNPFKESNSVERIAFMGIPAPDKEIQYYSRIADEFIDVLIGKLLPILDSR